MEHEELVKCSNCGSEDGFVIWQSLNATLNPEAKADMTESCLFEHKCPKCGHVDSYTYDLLYHDMESMLMIQLCELEEREVDYIAMFDNLSKERKRSNHKDELGVRIQNLGNYSNTTADEAVLDVMLEGAINGLNSAEDALSDPALVQEFKRREYVIVMMADEYASFRRHLHALSVKEQEIIIPLLKQEKDYYTLAEEAGVTVPVVRRKQAVFIVN